MAKNPLDGSTNPVDHWNEIGGRFLFSLVVVGLCALVVWQVVPQVLQGRLIDPDNYMRLVRVRQLAEGGGWFDSSIPRSNAPYGEILHWTRPLDVLLLFGSAFFLPFFPFSKALFLAGVFISPFFLLLTCYSAAWAAKPIAGRRIQFLAMIAVLAQPGVIQAGVPGRADHHALHILIFVLLIGMAIRWIIRPFSHRLALATGGLVALGLWVGPEFLVPLALLFFCGVVLWVMEGGTLARKNLWFSLGLLGVLLLALILEHPPSDLFSEEYDRISMPQVLVGVLALLFWMAVSGVSRSGGPFDRLKGRVFLATLGGLVCLGAISALYPAFLLGPEAQVDPRLTPLWRIGVIEDQPLVRSLSLWDLGMFISHLGPVVFCLPFLAGLLIKETDEGTWSAWFLLGVFLIAYSALAFFRIRFVPYPEILLVIISVSLISSVLVKLDSIQNVTLRVAIRVPFLTAVISGSLFLGFAFRLAGNPAEHQAMGEPEYDCPITNVTETLATREFFGQSPQTIAADLGYGPEILYRTNHRVLGTPYHRNSEGILAAFSILASTEPAEARELARDREVGLILICPGQSWIYSVTSDNGGGETTLHEHLAAGQLPDWLEPAPLPTESSGAFLLFRTNFGQRDP